MTRLSRYRVHISISLILAGAAIVLAGALLATGGTSPGNGALSRSGPTDDAEVMTNAPPGSTAINWNAPLPAVVMEPTSLRLQIQRIGVNAPIVKMGVENGVPEVPMNGWNVALYEVLWGVPGWGGNAVMAAHVNWARGPAVFTDLEEVEVGDVIEVRSLDGARWVYEVFENRELKKDDPEVLRAMGYSEFDSVTLLTCGGKWVSNKDQLFGGDYTHRVVVRARLVNSTPPVPLPAFSF